MRRRLGQIHITWWNTYKYLRDYYWPRMRQRNPIHRRAVTTPWTIRKVVKRAWRPEIRRDPASLEPHFTRHMLAMTSEGLHAKGEIALELAWRDAQIELLRDQLRQIDEWARCMCAATCKAWPEGKHAANCPVADLGIDQEGAS